MNMTQITENLLNNATLSAEVEANGASFARLIELGKLQALISTLPDTKENRKHVEAFSARWEKEAEKRFD